MSVSSAGGLFVDPTSVILIGDDRPLLGWVAYALAFRQDPDFRWVELRTKGEVLNDSDPVVRGAIPPDRLKIVRPSEFSPDHATANLGVSGVIRGDELPENVQILLDFLRLPQRTQVALSGDASRAGSMTYVLSNAHRLGSLYPAESVGPLLRAIQATGATTIMTFADAPNNGRLAFDVVVHLRGHVSEDWKQVTLKVEKGRSSGPLPPGSELRLGDLPALAEILARHLP